MHQATVQRPSARTVCEMSLAKTPARIHHMRPDALALLLTLANIGPHAKVLPRLQLATVLDGAWHMLRLASGQTVCWQPSSGACAW